MMPSACAGVGTPPLELLILDMPRMPTNAYIGPIGCCAAEDVTDEAAADDERRAGRAWSTPDGSNATPS